MRDSSGYRVAYHQLLHTDENAMKTLYADVQRRYNKRFERAPRFPVCYCRQSSYYEQMCVCLLVSYQ